MDDEYRDEVGEASWPGEASAWNGEEGWPLGEAPPEIELPPPEPGWGNGTEQTNPLLDPVGAALGFEGPGVRRRCLVKQGVTDRAALTPEQKLLVLDIWRLSGLAAGDLAPLVGVKDATLYAWRRSFRQQGPAGLYGRQRGRKRGSRVPEVTRRAIVLLKETHPDYGCDRISDLLLRSEALSASPGTVQRVLLEAGYEVEQVPTRPHPDRPRRFERSRPNQLWQTDLFTFVLKRQNRRVYLVAFMDDHSRFVVSFGLYAGASTANVLETLAAGIASYGAPEEVLTDNGPQYVTWRGTSRFTRELQKRGIKQLVAKPRRPQTLGKIERFWGTLWRECVGTSVFVDLADARRRVGLYIDHYNFHRTHQGIEGLVPADRYFGAAPQVLATLKAQVADNALELSRQGVPRRPFYVTGQVGGQRFSVHAEGERVVLSRADGAPEEVELVAPVEDAPALPEPVSTAAPAAEPELDALELPEAVPAPGTSPLDEALAELRGLRRRGKEDDE